LVYFPRFGILNYEKSGNHDFGSKLDAWNDIKSKVARWYIDFRTKKFQFGYICGVYVVDLNRVKKILYISKPRKESKK
jgi:hypothetical protein